MPPLSNIGMKLSGGRRRRRSSTLRVRTNAGRRLGQRYLQKCARPQLMPVRYRAEMEPLQWGIRPRTGRAVFVGGVNSGSPWRPPFLCPEVAQGKLGLAGASAFVVAASGRFRSKGAGHVALSRRTPYRVLQSECFAQPANRRMNLSNRGANRAAARFSGSSPRLAGYAQTLGRTHS